MERLRIFFAMMIAGLLIGGCSETPVEMNPPFVVPTTMMIQPKAPAEEYPTALALQVLPGSMDDYFFIGRAEKSIYTALPLSDISAYSIYTYDAQRISGPHQSGYRYTSLLREGVWAP